MGADQWQIEQRRKVSEITFDPRLDGTHLASLIKSFEPGENKKKEIAKIRLADCNCVTFRLEVFKIGLLERKSDKQWLQLILSKKEDGLTLEAKS